MEKKFTVDYLNSKKILARAVETSRKIDDIVHHQICKTFCSWIESLPFAKQLILVGLEETKQ